MICTWSECAVCAYNVHCTAIHFTRAVNQDSHTVSQPSHSLFPIRKKIAWKFQTLITICCMCVRACVCVLGRFFCYCHLNISVSVSFCTIIFINASRLWWWSFSIWFVNKIYFCERLYFNIPFYYYHHRLICVFHALNSNKRETERERKAERHYILERWIISSKLYTI